MPEAKTVSVEAEMPGPEVAYATLRTAWAGFGKPPSELSVIEREQVRSNVERELAMRAAVLESAEAETVTVGDDAVDAAIKELESRYDDRESFLSDLARNGLNRQGLCEALARELRVDAVLAHVAARAPAVTDEEVRDYYDNHRERFVYPETREVRHILITINEDIAENRRENALKRICQVAWRVKRRPRRFGEQALKHSECPTAMQEGRLGRVPKGRLFPELDAVLFGMQEGEISDPVESGLGFHLLYCEKIHAAGEMHFAEAAPRIRELLRRQRERGYQQAWLAERMRKTAAVQQAV